MTAPKVYTVSEISRGIKALLEGQYPDIVVQGEISGLKEAASGHFYFDLKDEVSNIATVMFRGSAYRYKAALVQGKLVKVTGNITTYDRKSSYQLMARAVEEVGKGPLQEAFERLKKKLQDKGYFDQQRKRPIPALPRQIGVVTSTAGAAIRDILSVLRRRYANMHIVIAPVKVQGAGAKEDIAQAIADLNAGFPQMDVMLVGRGGGSLEDLWAFNEEIVADAIFNSRIPVISCVGHETDFTIADFVADLRAATPSAAAEIVVKSKGELAAQIAGLERRLLQGLRVYYENLQGKFRRLASSRPLVNPLALLERPTRRLDDAVEGLFAASDERTRRAAEKLALLSAKIGALSPLFPLKKGYAIVKDAKGAAVKSAAALSPGDRLSLQFAEGRAEAEVLGGGAADRPKAPKQRSKNSGQGPEQENLW